MAGQTTDLHLFEGYGIELEYMIVNQVDLRVLPIADQILQRMAGKIVNEVEAGSIAWSNELVMHVLEIKSNGPGKDLVSMQGHFQKAILAMNKLLAEDCAMLMPTAMHPFFDPDRETKLWPYDNRDIYQAYNQIFDCRGHGWSNLQSIHINLPFCGDEEFGRLHAAIRLVLPILPALAASSPIVAEKVTGLLDNRLQYYKENQKKIPAIAGSVIPERVFTIADYQAKILEGMYREIAPHDPGAILQEEWLNSRGAIARFERNAIEIRLLDIQESVAADFAVIAAVVSLVKALVKEEFSPYAEQVKRDEQQLAVCLAGCIVEGENFMITDRDYLAALGQGTKAQTAGELWQQLGTRLTEEGYELAGFYEQFRQVTASGSLASRILNGTGLNPTRDELISVYGNLCSHLKQGSIYV